MTIELDVKENKAKNFISFLKELDFVKIKSKQKETKLSHADIIFGTSKPATDKQLKEYLSDSDSTETKDLDAVCEEVIKYLAMVRK